MVKMEVIMKKNYLLLMGLLLITPYGFASDSDDEETPIVSRQDVGMFADGFKAGAISLNNLSRLFGLFGQKMKEIAENTPENAQKFGQHAHAALDAAKQVAQGAASQVAKFGDNSTSLLARGKNVLEALDKTNNMFSTVIGKVNRTVHNVRTVFTAAKFLEEKLTHKEKDFKDPYGENEISFESPYLRNNQILRTLIEQNTEAIVPIKKRCAFHATIQNTNNRIKGVIFHGEPGTGKTETARALAKKLNIPFMFKSVSDIFATKFAGEAAEEVKRFFQEARRLVQQSTSKHPIKIIILLDEIDRLAAKRAAGNALRSEYGGAVMSDNNNTITAFMDEFNSSQHNEGILIIGTTNHYSKENFDEAIISRFTYGAIKFKKPKLEERFDYIQFYIQKDLALTIKESYCKPLNVKPLTIDECMEIAKTIINAWYANVLDENNPLKQCAQRFNDHDLRQLTTLVDQILHIRNQRLENIYNQEVQAINAGNALPDNSLYLTTPLEDFIQSPSREQSTTGAITQFFKKIGITKEMFPWIVFAITSGAGLKALITMFKKIAAQIPSALTFNNYVILNAEDKSIAQKVLCVAIIGLIIKNITSTAYAASQRTLNAQKIIDYYSNPGFAITQEDVDAFFGNDLEEDNSEESSEEYDDNDSNSSSNNSSETTLYC